MLSKDARFENDGIGPQTGITYKKDFEFYKRRLTRLYHSSDSAAWVENLLKTWDYEVFEHHNKQKGYTLADENTEIINIDAIDSDEADDSDVVDNMERLRIWASERTGTPNTNDLDAPPQAAGLTQGHNLPDLSDREDSDDIYGDEAPPPPGPGPILSAVPAALNPPTPSRLSSGESDSDEGARKPAEYVLPSKSLLPSLSNNNIAASATRFGQATSSMPKSVNDSDGSSELSDSDPDEFPSNTQPATSELSASAAALPKSTLPSKKSAPAKKPAPAPAPKATRRKANITALDTPTPTTSTPPDLIDIAPNISESQAEIAREPAAKPKRGRGRGRGAGSKRGK